MTPQAYCDLIHTYLAASRARDPLAARHAADGAYAVAFSEAELMDRLRTPAPEAR